MTNGIENNDALAMRKWGIEAADFESFVAIQKAAEFLVLATDEHERKLLRIEFEEGARNHAVNKIHLTTIYALLDQEIGRVFFTGNTIT